MEFKLVEKKIEAKDTKSFFFEPQEKVEFLAGQYFYITLPILNYPDTRGPVRQFTISSSPTEGNLLRITTRIRKESGFKKTLNEMAIGEKVNSEGPNGVFTLGKSPNKHNVFIAGGIGITPFRGIIKSSIDNGLKTPIHLIYLNTGPEFVFKKEIEEWLLANSWLTVYYHDSNASGHLGIKKLSKLIANNQQPTTNYWLSGPPAFVTATEDMLNLIKVEPELIHLDKFTGY